MSRASSKSAIASDKSANADSQVRSRGKTFARRLRDAAAEKGWNQSQLAKESGLSAGRVSEYWNGPKEPGTEYLFALADSLGVSARWLAQGQGPKHALQAETGDGGGLVMIPEVDIAFGLGGRVIEDYVDAQLVPFRRAWVDRITRGRPASLFLTRGMGDSMMPTILDDDDVLVNRAEAAVSQQDRIWAVGYGDLGMIKRVRRLPTGMFQLNSDNPSVTPIEASEDELFVVGRVIWIGRRV